MLSLLLLHLFASHQPSPLCSSPNFLLFVSLFRANMPWIKGIGHWVWVGMCFVLLEVFFPPASFYSVLILSPSTIYGAHFTVSRSWMKLSGCRGLAGTPCVLLLSPFCSSLPGCKTPQDSILGVSIWICFRIITPQSQHKAAALTHCLSNQLGFLWSVCLSSLSSSSSCSSGLQINHFGCPLWK